MKPIDTGTNICDMTMGFSLNSTSDICYFKIDKEIEKITTGDIAIS